MNNRGPHREISVADQSTSAIARYLLPILVACFLLRVLGIDWGLPPPLPSVVASGLRCSYGLDEDDVLSGVARTRLGSEFDPQIYHWGTLHLQIVLAVLESADAAGLFDHSWRKAYYDMIPGEFERVYRIGRLVTIVIAAAGLLPLFFLGRDMAFPHAGLFAAALIAVSPAHVLNSSQVRVDTTMMALVTLTAWLGIRAVDRRDARLPWLLAGASAGLAISAKYSAAIVVVAIVTTALLFVRFAWRPALLAFCGALAGFIAGEPGIITHRAEVFRQVTGILEGVRDVQPAFAIPVPELIARHLLDLARFSVGLPAALLAIYGCYVLLRRRRHSDYIILAGLAAAIVSLLPQRWVLLRYHLALVPFVALAAGIAITRLPRHWRAPAAVIALVFPLFGSIAEIDFMRARHPANAALDFMLKTIPPPEAIARMQVELPPLNPSDYPMGPNPYLDDLTHNPPRCVLTADLPDTAYPANTVALLRDRYEQLAVFESRRLFSWATLGERGAPHDWKYTHPRMVLYRRLGR